MAKSNKDKEYYLLHIVEYDKLMSIEAKNDVKKHVVDYILCGYYLIDEKPINTPIVKIFKIDENGNEIDNSPNEVKQNFFNYIDKLTSHSERVQNSANDVVKVSLHSQLQKQGSKKFDQYSLFDIVQDEKDQSNKDELISKVNEYKIEVVGLDLSKSQEKALFVIQTLLSNTNFKGNFTGKEIISKAMNFDGFLPAIKFTPSEYLKIYGVGKKLTERGSMEYNRNERDEALKALRDLAQKQFMMLYERKYWSSSKNEFRYDIIRAIKPLINIMEGFEQLNKSEKELVKDVDSNMLNDKLSAIVVEPNPILVDQINTYFVLKPANCYQEIKLLCGNASKFVYRFVDYLLTEYAQRNRKKGGIKNLEIKLNYETLGTILRMDSYIKTRNWKKLRNSINNCYETAKLLGYLSEYSICQTGSTKEIDVLILNPEKFRKIEEINKRREEIETENKLLSV